MLPKRASSRRLRCYRAGGPCRQVGTRVDAEPFTHAPRGGGGWGGGAAVARRGQRVDALELLLDRTGQRKGIEAVPLALQLGGHLGAERRTREHTVQRRAGRIVAAPDAGAHPFLAEQLHRGQEQVLEESQLAAVEGVDRGLRAWGVVAHVAEELADVGSVFLLDVGVVVFLVGPAAGELDLLGLAVVPEMLVDELRAVVGVDAPQGKGQGLAELREGPL